MPEGLKCRRVLEHDDAGLVRDILTSFDLDLDPTYNFHAPRSETAPANAEPPVNPVWCPEKQDQRRREQENTYPADDIEQKRANEKHWVIGPGEYGLRQRPDYQTREQTPARRSTEARS